MTTGQRIKAARKKAGMTQAALAQKLDIPFQSISQWERDIRNPKIETLQRIAAALDVPVNYLLGNEDIDGFLLPDNFADPDDYEFIKALGFHDPQRSQSLLSAPASISPKSFQPFTKTDNQLIQLGGFSAISEFYNLSEEDQKKALEDIRGFAEYVIEKYKKQASEDKKAPPQTE